MTFLVLLSLSSLVQFSDMTCIDTYIVNYGITHQKKSIYPTFLKLFLAGVYPNKLPTPSK